MEANNSFIIVNLRKGHKTKPHLKCIKLNLEKKIYLNIIVDYVLMAFCF